MKCILVDDEAHARALLRSYLKDSEFNIHIVGEAADVDSAIELIEYEKPDVVFLDIRIKERLGFEVLEHHRNKGFKVIFTTAYDQYALAAFEYAAVHYILKPFDQAAIDSALGRCIASKDSGDLNKLNEELNSGPVLTIPNRSETIRVKHSEILYLLGSGAYTEIYLRDGKTMMASKSLSHFENLLPSENFIRIHKKYLVKLSHITIYERGNKANCTLTNGQVLPVSRTYKQRLQEVIR